MRSFGVSSALWSCLACLSSNISELCASSLRWHHPRRRSIQNRGMMSHEAPFVLYTKTQGEQHERVIWHKNANMQERHRGGGAGSNRGGGGRNGRGGREGTRRAQQKGKGTNDEEVQSGGGKSLVVGGARQESFLRSESDLRFEITKREIVRAGK